MTSSYDMVRFDCYLPPLRGRIEPGLPSRSVFCCSCEGNSRLPILASYTFQSCQPSFRFGDGLFIEYSKVWREVAHPWEQETPGWSGELANTVANIYLSQVTWFTFPSLDSRVAIPVKIMVKNFRIYFTRLEGSLFSIYFQYHSTWRREHSEKELLAYCLFKNIMKQFF